jgi:hypothetical protein
MGAEGCTRVVRREFVTDITSGVGALEETRKYPIDPSFSQTFPWLNGIALHYQKYTVLGLCAEYIPTSGYAVGTSSAALGTVNACFRYDVMDATSPTYGDYTVKKAILGCEGAVSSSPAAGWILPLECADDSTVVPVHLMHNNDTTFSGAQTQFYRAGDLWLTATGSQSEFTCGELWLTYDIVLMDPILPHSWKLNPGVLTEEEKHYENLHSQVRKLMTRGLDPVEGAMFFSIEEIVLYVRDCAIAQQIESSAGYVRALADARIGRLRRIRAAETKLNKERAIRRLARQAAASVALVKDAGEGELNCDTAFVMP